MEKDLSNIRKTRRSGHDGTQEFFTPDNLADEMFDKLPNDMFTDLSKTYCDTCAGNGNLIIKFLIRRLQYCKTEEDKIKAISTIYGVELMQDNVDECKERIYNLVGRTPEIEKIVNHNIVCSDFFKWDFYNWKPVEDSKSVELF